MAQRSATRVEAHSPRQANDKIRQQTLQRLEQLRKHPELINKRLAELEEEWDIERALQTGAASLTLAGLGLSAVRSRFWLLLPAVVAGFFMQHAVQGWCPPIEVFRRLGFRTRREIEHERTAVKLLRGDFEKLISNDHRATPGATMRAIERG